MGKSGLMRGEGPVRSELSVAFGFRGVLSLFSAIQGGVADRLVLQLMKLGRERGLSTLLRPVQSDVRDG